MFLFKLSSWLDRYDPYWYSRLMSLKIVCIAIAIFIVNMLSQPLLSPLMMMIAGAGALIIEMPTINNLDKKDNLYLGYVLLMCFTIGIFSGAVYLRGWFIVAVALWMYLLYYALRKKPELFPIVSIVIMLGVMGQEGLNTGNFYIILNEIFFILEFAFFVFWAHKLFPKIYHNIWFSSLLRSLETMQKMLHNQEALLGERQLLFKHIQAGKNSLDLLRNKPYLREIIIISNYLSYYHYFLSVLLHNDHLESLLVARINHDIANLENAVRRQKILVVPDFEEDLELSADSLELLQSHRGYFAKLSLNWNKLCVAKNS